jgi:hypothetical protein
MEQDLFLVQILYLAQLLLQVAVVAVVTGMILQMGKMVVQAAVVAVPILMLLVQERLVKEIMVVLVAAEVHHITQVLVVEQVR